MPSDRLRFIVNCGLWSTDSPNSQLINEILAATALVAAAFAVALIRPRKPVE